MSDQSKLTHFDSDGNAIMVDISGKSVTGRTAIAAGEITMNRQAFEMVRSGTMAKGDVLGVARLAGIMAAKKVAELIPLTHPLLIDSVTVDFAFDAERCAVIIEASVSISGRTGVEMEALTAASVAALTIYDMCKAIDRSMVIEEVRLLHKAGGRSGTWSAGASR